MGIWGPGNFEDDTSAEHLVGTLKPLLDQIAATAANDELMTPDEYDGAAMIANLEILACLAEGLGMGASSKVPPSLGLPMPSVIERWRDDYLRVWDASIDALAPKPQYKRARRKVIEQTFDRLVAASGREHPE